MTPEDELPAPYREALDEDEQLFLLAWLKVFRDQVDLSEWERELGLSPAAGREYRIRIMRKLNKRSSGDLIKEGLEAMGWWPPPKPSWWRPGPE